MVDTFTKDNLIIASGFRDGIETITEIVNIGIIAVSSVQVVIADTSDNCVITFSGVDGVMTVVSVNDIIIRCSINSIICIGLLQRCLLYTSPSPRDCS